MPLASLSVLYRGREESTTIAGLDTLKLIISVIVINGSRIAATL